MERDFIGKNIELSAEFSRYLFENPDLEKQIPLGAEIILLPEFDAELRKHNLKTGRKFKKKGVKVTYMKIEKLKPRMLSRIDGVKLETVRTV